MSFLKKILLYLLTLESRLIIAKYRPFIVAVTGSVGKTSTKDAIFAVLKSAGGYVRKSEKSFNSEIGLPLTVIGVPNAWKSLPLWWKNVRVGLSFIVRRREYPSCLILEIGADHPGDIRRVTRWLRPDIAVITRVSRTPVHVEFFRSPEDVFLEKAALAEAVKAGGTVVLFADDDKVMSIVERVKDVQPRIISFGLSAIATVRGSAASSTPEGLSFTMNVNGSSGRVNVAGVAGETYEYPLLAAAAVGLARGMSTEQIFASLAGFVPPRGRLNLIAGIRGSTLIDDTYNSSPDAASSALAALRGFPTPGRRMAVLGDMMELGRYAAEEHRRIGREAACIVSELITVGPRSRATAEEALQAGLSSKQVHSYDSAEQAAEYLAPIVAAGDTVLIKGSQRVRMEHAVKVLMADPSRAAELLVRQESEWSNR